MPNIVLIRPGCTTYDEQQRIQGTLDLPLTTQGEAQLVRLLTELSQVEIDVIYTSPSEPARMTAAKIVRGIPVKEVEGLVNVNLGLWQGLQVEEIRRKHPKVFKQWQESPEAICPPEGETFAEAIERVRRALEKPLRKGNLAFVAADPLASIVCAAIRGVPLENPSPTCVHGCGSWQVVKENAYKSLTGEFAVPTELAASRSG